MICSGIWWLCLDGGRDEGERRDLDGALFVAKCEERDLAGAAGLLFYLYNFYDCSSGYLPVGFIVLFILAIGPCGK